MLNEVNSTFTIEVGHTYEEGKALLNSRSFDVVVLDINLPDKGKSGIDLLKFSLAQSFSPQVKIMMTTDPTAEKEKLCLMLGADYFLNKFSDFERIPEIISRFLSLQY